MNAQCIIWKGPKNNVLLKKTEVERRSVSVCLCTHSQGRQRGRELFLLPGQGTELCVISRATNKDKLAVRGRNEKFPKYQSHQYLLSPPFKIEKHHSTFC